MTNIKEKKSRQVKDDRSILKMIIFNILTLGIYGIWYEYHLIEDIRYLFEDEDTPLPSFWIYLLYSIFTLGIYQIYYWLRASDLMRKQALKRRLDVEISSGFIAFCFVVGYFVARISTLVAFHTIFTSLNTIAEDYNRNIYPKVNR